MPRTPCWGGGTSNITMSPAWSASTVSRSPACTAAAHRSISSRISFSATVLLLSSAFAIDTPARRGNSSDGRHDGPVQDWEQRVAAAWASFDDYEGREDTFRALIDDLARELPADDPIAAFERACAWDSTGYSDRAVPL